MSGLRPTIDDMAIKASFLAEVSRDESPEVVVALCRLMAYAAARMAWTYTPPDPLGRLPSDDIKLARIAGLRPKQWAKIRPGVARFFREQDGAWVLAGDWIEVCAPGTIRPAIPASLRTEIMKRDGYRCTYCGADRGPFDLDHVVPIALGGITEADNLACACAACNRSKGALSLEQWMRTR